MEPVTADRYERLLEILRGMGGVVVAFSGGVDSTLLLAAAREALGDRVLAVTARSPTYPEGEYGLASEVAAAVGARHVFTDTHEMDDPCFTANPKDRCYHCKSELFATLARIGAAEGLPHVVEGSNVDDDRDYRPGRRAVSERGVRSPLAEAGLGKDEVRALLRERGLPNWDKPSLACLASRIPYGQAITLPRLARIAAAESAIAGLGFPRVRVREHGDAARIEVDPERVAGAADPGMRDRIVKACRDAGFTWVSLDLQGYRTGAMNEGLADAVSGRGRERA